MAELPDKLYFKIGEVAKLADTAPHVIRYWEQEFEQITPKRAKSGQRLFRREDVLFIFQVKDLLHKQGLTIAGAKKYLLQQKTQNKLPSEARSSYGDACKIAVIKEQLLQIREILGRSPY